MIRPAVSGLAVHTADAPTRYPLRPRTDGDFDLARLCAAARRGGQPAVPAKPYADVGEAAAALRLWDLPHATAAAAAGGPPVDTMTGEARDALSMRRGSPPRPADLQTLHAFETAALLKPPVAERTAALTPAIARAWLTLAAHWVGVATAIADLRFLNGACKLLGAVSVHHCAPAMRTHVTAVAELIETATLNLETQLSDRLQTPLDGTCDVPPGRAPQPRAGQSAPGGNQPVPARRVMVLAAAGSRSAAHLAMLTAARGAPVTAICWYQPTGQPVSKADQPPSGYAEAWYPPAEAGVTSPPDPQLPADLPQLHASGWDQVANVIDSHDTDLLLLAGMPIVPAAVLDRAQLGVLNAHNGALPTYCGMDAVAWAILNNDPVVCSLHRAAPGVDTGEVYTAVSVPLAPTETLRVRVKDVQLRLLSAAAAHVISTGALPSGTTQPAGLGRQFYRLHPHLKRVLDASPYGQSPKQSAAADLQEPPR